MREIIYIVITLFIVYLILKIIIAYKDKCASKKAKYMNVDIFNKNIDELVVYKFDVSKYDINMLGSVISDTLGYLPKMYDIHEKENNKYVNNFYFVLFKEHMHNINAELLKREIVLDNKNFENPIVFFEKEETINSIAPYYH